MTDYVYLAIDYSATGEGHTKYLLVTRAYPRPDDYDVQPRFDADWKYIPGVLKSTPEQIATHEMLEFGVDPYFIQGVESLTQDVFMQRYDQDIPEYIKKIIGAAGSDRPGNFKYFSALHVNYS